MVNASHVPLGRPQRATYGQPDLPRRPSRGVARRQQAHRALLFAPTESLTRPGHGRRAQGPLSRPSTGNARRQQAHETLLVPPARSLQRPEHGHRPKHIPSPTSRGALGRSSQPCNSSASPYSGTPWRPPPVQRFVCSLRRPSSSVMQTASGWVDRAAKLPGDSKRTGRYLRARRVAHASRTWAQGPGA